MFFISKYAYNKF
jgi:hypothetical protein